MYFLHGSLKKQTLRALWKSATEVFGSNELIGIPMSLSIGSFENYSNFLCSGLRCVHIFWPPRILKLQLLGIFLKREVCNNTFRCIFFAILPLGANSDIWYFKGRDQNQNSHVCQQSKISLRVFRWHYWSFKVQIVKTI